MFPFADPMRLMQTWCEATTAMTRAQMAAYEAVGSQMAAFWTGALPTSQTKPVTWLDQWSASVTPRAATPLNPFLPTAFAPPSMPTSMPFNPWATMWGVSGSPFAALFAGMAEAANRSAAFADAQSVQPQAPARDTRSMSVVDASYRGAGGHAMAPSIKFSAEVPVSTLAALASMWAWPWPTARAG